MPINFHSASPILRVANLAASLDYYQKVLGFTLDWHDPDGTASVSRLSCHLMLVQGGQGLGKAWVYIGVGDADALFEEYTQKGAKIQQTPNNFYWGCEMHVEDLDGNVLRMASEAKENVPFGPWVDMNGDTWAYDHASDKWTKAGHG